MKEDKSKMLSVILFSYMSEDHLEAACQKNIKVLGKARKRVEEILSSPRKNQLSDDVTGKLEDIVRRANEELPSET